MLCRGYRTSINLIDFEVYLRPNKTFNGIFVSAGSFVHHYAIASFSHKQATTHKNPLTRRYIFSDKFTFHMLYKYRSINDRTTEIFRTKKVWLAKPSSLNDPLECRIPKISKQDIHAHAEQKMSYQVMGFISRMPISDGKNPLIGRKKGEEFYGKSDREVRILFKRISKARDIQKKYRIINNFLKSIGLQGMSDPYDQLNSIKSKLENVGIFSLSEDPANMLMWSHYAQNHEGIAIGFDHNSDSKISDNKFCRKVAYQDDLPKIDPLIGFSNSVAFFAGNQRPQNYVNIDDPQIQRILFTKTSSWDYEKEWRYFEETYGSYDIPSDISEVIFGLKCSDMDQKSIIDVCNNNFPHKINFKKVEIGNDGRTLLCKPAKI